MGGFMKLVLFGLVLALAGGAWPAWSAEEGLFGVLQLRPEHAAEGRAMGLNVAVLAVAWDRFEPRAGEFDAGYIAQLAAQKSAFRRAGYRLQLDPGIQYAPVWVAALPQGRYRNQYGEEFAGGGPGERLPNVVFNAQVRARIAVYFHELFRQLGSDWDFVRLGGGKFGELNYPRPRQGSHGNCYWAFDDLAQGKAPGLPEAIPPCPVPGWVPGTPSENHQSAARFAEWYLNALNAYQDWQIATVRRDFSGEVCLLYGSWGIRPGELPAAIAGDLGGATPPEHNGEIQQGYDWARMIGGITDSRAIVYCTWIDGTLQNRELGDDTVSDPLRWSPVHWQASLARQNPLHPRVWGENTGQNDLKTLRLVFEQIRRYDLMGVLWAFDSDLRADPNPRGWATWADLAAAIAERQQLVERAAPGVSQSAPTGRAPATGGSGSGMR